jgi:soluble lytic murein transglycosylase-like protein
MEASPCVKSVVFRTVVLVGLLLLCPALVLANDVPPNTIIGSSGRQAKVANITAPQPYKKKVKVYKYSDDGTASFSDRPPKGQSYEVLAYKCYACDVNSTIDWYTIPLYPEKFAGTISQAALTFGVDPALVRAVIHAESAFRPDVTSHKGAAGLMQLMPLTAEELGVADRYNPEENIFGGVKYLAQLLDQFNGDIKLAAAAYNAGPGAVVRHGGVPPYAETLAYVERVAILAERYRG